MMFSAPSVPELYPLGLSFHAALAGVPPVEVLVVVQLFVALLKLSLIIVTEVAEFEVADEVRLMDCPEQMDAEDAVAVTDVGA